MAGNKPITFIVFGTEQPPVVQVPWNVTRSALGSHVQELGLSEPKHSVRLARGRDSDSSPRRLPAVPGEDVVLLHITGEQELVLVLHPEHALQLLQSQQLVRAQQRQRTRAQPTARDADDPYSVVVPSELDWGDVVADEAARRSLTGVVGKVLLRALEIWKGPVGEQVSQLAAGELAERFVKHVDAQVTPGLYRLDAARLLKLKDVAAPETELAPSKDPKAPLLVLIHGTFSATHSSFGKLWNQHPQLVQQLFEHYGRRVYGLEHKTLGESPIANALLLANSLPSGARLHLLTHSRGGLVAEVLARASAPSWTDPPKSLEAGDRQLLESLRARLIQQDIRVERIVRVACPTRGTLLASRRLDALLSVFIWLLRLSQIPVAPELLQFLAQVAKYRLQPDVIPGLAAQVPHSPLVQWLHAGNEAVPGQLRVISGDTEGDSLFTWVKTLLADRLIFGGDANDFVVHTSSMYGGAKRRGGSLFFLEHGGDVSHTAYFANKRTADATVRALVDEVPADFVAIGLESWAGTSASGVRGLRRGQQRDPNTLPTVFLVPGLFGSQLKVEDRRIWLSDRVNTQFQELAYRDDDPVRVTPDGLDRSLYGELADYLSETHYVVEFDFDWRLSFEAEAKRLATRITQELDRREPAGQLPPLRILAHSTGGLLVRALQWVAQAVWDRMLRVNGSRILLLGTPHLGLWTPFDVLTGRDTLGNLLSSIGEPGREAELRQQFADFPGFVQWQACLLEPQSGLALEKTWTTLQRQAEASNNRWHDAKLQRWGRPSQQVLNEARKFHERLHQQSTSDSWRAARDRKQLTVVIGEAPYTPDGYAVSPNGLTHLDLASAGDGYVTHRSALLEGVPAFRIQASHAELTTQPKVFPALGELLEQGSSTQLTAVSDADRQRAAESKTIRRSPARGARWVMPPQNLGDLFRTASTSVSPTLPALRITITNGNLQYMPHALLLGHYTSVTLGGTEAVVNKFIGHTMSQMLSMGQYPSELGQYHVFENRHKVDPNNPLQPPKPRAAIVIGLGSEGNLKGAELIAGVRQGVLAWAQRLVEKEPDASAFELAATLLGSGGTGISAGQSAQLIAQGVREANQLLTDKEWPTVSRLQLIELYQDRAVEAWRQLKALTDGGRAQYTIEPQVQLGQGRLTRPPELSYRGSAYDFISAVSQPNRAGEPSIEYTIDTKRARSEVRAQATQLSLVRELLSRASDATDGGRDGDNIGRTLFQLLVPLEMDVLLRSTTEVLLELDQGTSGIPWELLEPPSVAGDSNAAEPWAIRAKLLRKLRTERMRTHVQDANRDLHVLVIGEPDTKYVPLPGAREEAIAVRDVFRGVLGPDNVHVLVSDDETVKGPNALQVINQLFARDYRIIHIAGHGTVPEAQPTPQSVKSVSGSRQPATEANLYGGVVLSGDTVLGPHEIEQMRVVPELVFLNCCHLGRRSPEQTLLEPKNPIHDRPEFAARVAEKLIEIGVRCVVAAGWAIDDRAAKAFASKFYENLLKHARFIDAVAEARKAAREADPNGKTWAAYQCYGDPDWRFQAGVGDSQQPRATLKDYSDIASPQGLIYALNLIREQNDGADQAQESLTTSDGSAFNRSQDGHVVDALKQLEGIADKWPQDGHVAEAFGEAWANVDRARSITWYRRAVASPTTASLRAVEQLGNLLVATAEERADNILKTLQTQSRPIIVERNSKLGKAQQRLERGRRLLQKAASIEGTSERHSLLGSAWKRQAMIEVQLRAPDTEPSPAEQKALAQSERHYAIAVNIARSIPDADVLYPGLNHLAIALVRRDKSNLTPFKPEDVQLVRQALADKNVRDPNFWSTLGQTELKLYEALATYSLARQRDEIDAGYLNLHNRITGTKRWKSAADQLRFIEPYYKRQAESAEFTAYQDLRELVEVWAYGSASANKQSSAAQQTAVQPTDPRWADVVQKYQAANWTAVIETCRSLPLDMANDRRFYHLWAHALNERSGAVDQDAALGLLDRLVSVIGEDAETLSIRGQIFKDRWRQTGRNSISDLDRAIADYKRAFELQPTKYETGFEAASLVFMRGAAASDGDAAADHDLKHLITDVEALLKSKLENRPDTWVIRAAIGISVMKHDWSEAQRLIQNAASSLTPSDRTFTAEFLKELGARLREPEAEELRKVLDLLAQSETKGV